MWAKLKLEILLLIFIYSNIEVWKSPCRNAHFAFECPCIRTYTKEKPSKRYICHFKTDWPWCWVPTIVWGNHQMRFQMGKFMLFQGPALQPCFAFATILIFLRNYFWITLPAEPNDTHWWCSISLPHVLSILWCWLCQYSIFNDSFFLLQIQKFSRGQVSI